MLSSVNAAIPAPLQIRLARDCRTINMTRLATNAALDSQSALADDETAAAIIEPKQISRKKMKKTGAAPRVASSKRSQA